LALIKDISNYKTILIKNTTYVIYTYLGVLHFGRLLPTGISAIVVEDDSIRIFPADCPILNLFKLYHLSIFHLSVLALRLKGVPAYTKEYTAMFPYAASREILILSTCI